MAPPRTVVTTASCSLLLINRPRKDERLSWRSWLTYSGRFTHISRHSSAVGRAQDSESSPVKDQRSTAETRNQPKMCDDDDSGDDAAMIGDFIQMPAIHAGHPRRWCHRCRRCCMLVVGQCRRLCRGWQHTREISGCLSSRKLVKVSDCISHLRPRIQRVSCHVAPSSVRCYDHDNDGNYAYLALATAGDILLLFFCKQHYVKIVTAIVMKWF